MFILRFSFYFILSFGILCLPVGNNQNLFEKLHSFVTPYTNAALKTTKQKFGTTKRYSRKLYSNSEPIENDEVKTKLSGIKKKIVNQNRSAEDTYTEEERSRLQKVLNED